MKSWHETSRIYDAIARAQAAGEPSALATLVRIEGSSYRRVGAKLLIRADGALCGQVSGGCLEQDLKERALRLLAEDGEPELVRYDTGADDQTLWGLGLGCNGRLDVFLQPLPARDDTGIVAEVRRRLAGLEAFALRTTLDGREAGRIVTGPPFTDEMSGIVAAEGARDYVDHLEPPADLVVIGAGDDAIPLVRIAAQAGFRVTVVDHRAAYLDAARFPDAAQLVQARPGDSAALAPLHAQTYAVVMNHALELDRAWALRLADTPAPYFGLLGPRARRDEIVAALPEAARARAYGPVGLDIGAEGAEQIAISIVAEALAVEAGRAGGSLRNRGGAIHG